MDFLFVPGWGSSGPDHWQSHWEKSLIGARRVDMLEWSAPRRDAWIAILDRYVREAPGSVLVGHSLGCATIAHWAASAGATARVRAAWLVAPVDLDSPSLPEELREFAPTPRARLPFPSKLVGSSNDVYLSASRAAELADAWGSELEILEGAGHINTASGHGPWPDGLASLRRYVRELA